MVNSMVPEKHSITSQTEDPPTLKVQRVLSLEIEPPEIVLPTLKPPTVYMAEDQKNRFISRLMTDPEKKAMSIAPLKKGMTFKKQLEQEERDRKEYEEKRKRWDDFEADLKRREERANELQKQAQKVI